MNQILDQFDQLGSIEPKKLKFLKEIIQLSRDVKEKDNILPLFMKISQKAKAEKITFTDSEMKLIISILKQNSNEQENAVIDKIVNYQPNSQK